MTRNKAAKLQTCMAIFATTLFGSGRALAVDMSQTPLFLTGSVEPNIVYMIDDSGSMQFEVMPDEIMDGVRYLFDTPDGVYGDDVYSSDDLPGTGPDSDDGAFYRSSANNSLFYDPSVDYKPWVKADGSRMPQADPEAAYYNPRRTGVGTLDLTEESTICVDYDWWGNCDDWETFYPATYYEFTGSAGDDRDDADNYDHVQIKSGNNPFPSGRTYNEEIQNFANWFTYYRSRILTAMAGTGEAFSQQGNKIRVGYGRINAENENVDGFNSDQGMVSGVRSFEGAEREDFFDDLYTTYVGHNVGTPLRRALEGAGDYYEKHDGDRGPWSTTPGEAGGDQYECRSSYTILMTDGYWSGDPPDVDESDNSSGSLITNPDPEEDNFTYSPVEPFADSEDETLADVAMHYWKRDLRDNLDNKLPGTGPNPAFWQHMVTYGVGLGVEGSINPDDAFDAVPDQLGDAGDEISWPDPDDGGAAKIDDLLHAAVNSRGGFFSAQNPDEFARSMSEMLQSLVGRAAGSGSSVATNSTRLETDSLIFQGRFDSSDWSGDLRAYGMDEDGNIATVEWRSAELLDNRNLSSNPRTIATWDRDGEQGVSFEWGNLPTEQRQLLQDGDGANTAQDRIDYIRGDRGGEFSNGGSFRDRGSRLGDIINSRPVYTKDERYGYRGYGGGKGSEYVTFIQGMQDATDPQPGMVYVGGNDGMLHGFNAQSGEEVFSYVPSGVYDKLANLTDPQYQHQYYVDGSPTVGDAYIDADGDGDKEWRRILIGTLGGGGSTVFALDITDPESFNAQDDVLWEFSHDELGQGVKSASLVRVLVDDPNNAPAEHRWDVIFGNGYNSDSNNSKLFVLDAENGTMRGGAPIDVGSGTASDPNGMATPFVVDEDQDRNADLIYAGDLNGNLWRFTLNNQADWEKDYKLFAAENDDDEAQSITSQVDVGLNSDGDKVVTFGTGKYMENGDDEPGSASAQDLYGIFDTGSSVDRDDLLTQTLESQTSQNGVEFRIVSDNALADDDEGWHVSLDPDGTAAKEGERSVVRPVVNSDRVIFTSIVPSTNPCDAGGSSWLTAVDINHGGRPASSFFDTDGDMEVDQDDLVDTVNDGKVAPTSMGKQGIIDTPTVLSGDDTDRIITSSSEQDSTAGGGGGGGGPGPGSDPSDSRGREGPQSWRQIR